MSEKVWRNVPPEVIIRDIIESYDLPSAKEAMQNAAENFSKLPSAHDLLRREPVSERRDEWTKIEVDPQIELGLHQAELFGPRYTFYLLLDKQKNFKLSVEQARKLHEAFGELLAKVEEE